MNKYPKLLLAVTIFGLFWSSNMQPVSAQVDRSFVRVDQNLKIPDEAKELGHHGKVILSGNLLPDGTITDLEITQSSASDILDKHALNRFGKARLGSDLMKSGKEKVRLEVTYADTNFGLIESYPCRQAGLDFAWYLGSHPGSRLSDTRFMSLLRGLNLLAQREELNFLKDEPRTNIAAQKALEICAGQPEENFTPIFLALGKQSQATSE